MKRIGWFCLLACLYSGSAWAKCHAFTQTGIATVYASSLEGNRTSSGEAYDETQFTAAHRTLPMNTKVRVINRRTGRSVTVRINDRGPFAEDRLIDLSKAAAQAIGMEGGILRVRIKMPCH